MQTPLWVMRPPWHAILQRRILLQNAQRRQKNPCATQRTIAREIHRTKHMGLFRLLVLGALLWFVLKVLKEWRIELVRKNQRPGARGDYEPITPCSHCGVYLPRKALDANRRCRACAHAG